MKALRVALWFCHKVGKLKIKEIVKYIEGMGYTVVFYNTAEGDKLSQSFNIADMLVNRQAVTVRCKNRKFVFVNNELSHENKMLALLHEAGHILLNHIDNSTYMSNSEVQEIEADAFVYVVLWYKHYYCFE